MKWGQCDKKLTTAQRILSPSLVCAWLVMRKLVSPTIVFVWYTASIVNTGWVSSEECERVLNVYFCTQICVTIKSKLRMSGKNQHREKKPYKLSMCQSVSNGFLLKWNQHEAPADTWSKRKRKVHCTQKRMPYFCTIQTYTFGGTHINRRPFNQTIMIAMKRPPPPAPTTEK